MAKKTIVWVLGLRPKHPYLCTPYASKIVLGYLGWGCLGCTMLKTVSFGFQGGAPNTLTTVPCRPANPMVRVFAAPPQNQFFLASFGSNTTMIGIQNTFAGVWGTEVWVWRAPPQNQKVFFDPVQFKHPHFRYSTIPLLTYGVHGYGCLGRHPGTQTILFGTV